jgi:DNA primase
VAEELNSGRMSNIVDEINAISLSSGKAKPPLIDWLRNAIGNTAIGSFCPRARPGAIVATPLAWDEVNAELDPARFTLRTVPERLAPAAGSLVVTGETLKVRAI